jgi:hypothetical protein
MNKTIPQDYSRHKNYNSIAKVYLSRYPDINYTVLIEAEKDWLGYYYEPNYINDKNWCKMAKTLSYSYRGVALLHTHQKQRKGGYHSPHCHLALYVPKEQQVTFDEYLKYRLKRINRKRMFRIVDSVVDELDQSSKRIIRDTSHFIHYIFGENRIHLPEVIWERG